MEETVRFKADGMMCQSCEKVIYKQALATEGVKNCEADYATQEGKVTFDGERTDINKILGKIEEKGYKCSVIEEPKAPAPEEAKKIEGVEKVGFEVKGMKCPGCEEIIKDQALKIRGVKNCEIDYVTRKGSVTFDLGKTDIDSILDKIEEKGYECFIIGESITQPPNDTITSPSPESIKESFKEKRNSSDRIQNKSDDEEDEHNDEWIGWTIGILGVLFIGYLFLNSVDFTQSFNADTNSITGGAVGQISGEGYQEVRMDVLASGWSPNKFVLKKGVPVKWVINGKELTGCNSAIQVPKLGLNFDIKKGEQVIEFTPNEEGVIPFSCWMGMLRGSFIVKGDIDLSDKGAVQKELNAVDVPKGGSCGAGGGGCGCGGR